MRMIDVTELLRFREEGFLVVRALLDPDAELHRFRTGYSALADLISERFIAEAGDRNVPELAGLPFGDRFAVAMGASGGRLLDHLDPGLVLRSPSFRYRPDLPSAQIPELFELMTARPLLDALATLIGPEIQASPSHHLQFKLNGRQLNLASDVASASSEGRRQEPIHDFLVDRAGWHQDATWGLPDAYESDVVVAWVPLTDVGPANGPLLAVPGSHREGVLKRPYPKGLTAAAVPLCVERGDVVFLTNKTIHSSEPNRGADARWAMSFRYAPIGHPTGRPYLPDFTARSTSAPARELHDPQLWSAMWGAALRDACGWPWELPEPGAIGLDEARALTAIWRERAPDPIGWLEVGSRRRTVERLTGSLRRSARRSPLARRIYQSLRG